MSRSLKDDDITSQLESYYRNKRKPCHIVDSDIDFLKDYFKSNLKIEFQSLFSNLQKVAFNPGLIMLVPTFVMTTDNPRYATLMRNIEIYLDQNSINRVILFFYVHSTQKQELINYYKTVIEDQKSRNQQNVNERIEFIIYSHKSIDNDPKKSHVGRARAAIAYYICSYIDPEQIVVISDDRRHLSRFFPENLDIPIGELIGNVIKYLKGKKKTVIIPACGNCRPKSMAYSDIHSGTRAQIYFSKASTFRDIYICSYKNSTCDRKLASLDDCFARLFEDCSFVNAGYDYQFDMLIDPNMRRRTSSRNIATVARKYQADMSDDDRLNVFHAMGSCLVYAKDTNDKYWIRWGNEIQTFTKKTDGYDAHIQCFKDAKIRKVICLPDYAHFAQTITQDHCEDSMCNKNQDSHEVKIKQHKRLKEKSEEDEDIEDEDIEDEDYPHMINRMKDFPVDEVLCREQLGLYRVIWRPMWITQNQKIYRSQSISAVLRTKNFNGEIKYLVAWKPDTVNLNDADNLDVKNCPKRQILKFKHKKK